MSLSFLLPVVFILLATSHAQKQQLCVQDSNTFRPCSQNSFIVKTGAVVPAYQLNEDISLMNYYSQAQCPQPCSVVIRACDISDHIKLVLKNMKASITRSCQSGYCPTQINVEITWYCN